MTNPAVPAPAVVGTRAWTLVGVGGPADIELTAADDATLGDVLPRLGRALGVEISGLWSGSQALPGDLPLSAAALHHGAVLDPGE